MEEYLPPEIQEIIFDMKFHTDHHENFQACLRQIEIPRVIHEFRDVLLHYSDDQHPYLYDFLRIHMNTSPSKMLSILSSCTCCKRHQKNRPKKMTPNIPLKFYMYEGEDVINPKEHEHECGCMCRHYARECVRMVYFNHRDEERIKRITLFKRLYNYKRKEQRAIAYQDVIQKELELYLELSNDVRRKLGRIEHLDHSLHNVYNIVQNDMSMLISDTEEHVDYMNYIRIRIMTLKKNIIEHMDRHRNIITSFDNKLS